MAKIVDIREAKTHLSKLLDEVTAGHEVIIARAGADRPMRLLSNDAALAVYGEAVLLA